MSERNRSQSPSRDAERAHVADTHFEQGDRQAAVSALEQIDNQQLRDLVRAQWWGSLSEQEQNRLLSVSIIDYERLSPGLSDPD